MLSINFRKNHQMAPGEDIKGIDRVLMNTTIVLGLLTIGCGLLYIFTNWDIAKTVLFIVGPLAVLGIFAGVIRAFWPRNEV